MKKIITFLLVLIVLVTFTSCGNKSIQDYDEYCYKLNQIIKDIDFDKGVIQYGMISLLKDDEIVFETTFAEYDKRYEIKYIRKEDNRIFYVLNGSVDDDDGIVFVSWS